MGGRTVCLEQMSPCPAHPSCRQVLPLYGHGPFSAHPEHGGVYFALAQSFSPSMMQAWN